jgi:hypothetical protein
MDPKSILGSDLGVFHFYPRLFNATDIFYSQKVKKDVSKIFRITTMVMISLSLVACKPMTPVLSPTVSSTPVVAPTEKPTATKEATPTVEPYAIDMEKFTEFLKIWRI